jgi:DNA-directed RNA polymerase specialized sigma subunit
MITPQNKEILFDMTDNFEYDENSFTSGTLEYKLNNLQIAGNKLTYYYDEVGNKIEYGKLSDQEKLYLYNRYKKELHRRIVAKILDVVKSQYN